MAVFRTAEDELAACSSRKLFNRANSFEICGHPATITQLIPFDPTHITTHAMPPTEGYMWDETPNTILDKLAIQYIEAQFQHLIFQSLLSEHAARFISMDNSTRNANTLLTDTKLEYNKIRQAKITTEITELTGNF